MQHMLPDFGNITCTHKLLLPPQTSSNVEIARQISVWLHLTEHDFLSIYIGVFKVAVVVVVVIIIRFILIQIVRMAPTWHGHRPPANQSNEIKWRWVERISHINKKERKIFWISKESTSMDDELNPTLVFNLYQPFTYHYEKWKRISHINNMKK